MRTDINIWTDDKPLKARHDEADGFLWLSTDDDPYNRSLTIFGNAAYLSRLAKAINQVAQQPDQDDDGITPGVPGDGVDLDDEIPF